jgi:tripartite-type tricarboxylate transporter receptor subunit TctC
MLRLTGAAIAIPFAARSAQAQTYPSRPVRVIVTTGPGGQGDTTARLIAQTLSENLGQPFYVENVVGGGGNIAHGTAARATPDGHTILAAGGAFVANPSLYAKIAMIRTRISRRSRWSARPPTCSRCTLRCRRTASASLLRRRRPIPAS